MARPTDKNEETSEYLPVLNRHTRLTQLAYATRDEKTANADSFMRGLKNETIVCPPGISFVKRELLELCGMGKPGDLDPFKPRANNAVTIEDPTKLPVYDAVKIASVTGSRHGLRMWKQRESRAEVIAAIDERLASKKVK